MHIAAVAHRIPSRQITNEEVVQEVFRRSGNRLDNSGRAQVQERLTDYFAQTGIVSRFCRDDGEKAAVLGIEAARQALEEAGVAPEEVDLLMYVGVGRGWVEPAMANLFLSELGLKNATGFDILDACASWLRAVHIAQQFFRAGGAKNALILNSECNIREHCDFVVPNIESLEYLLPGFTIGEASTATLLTNGSAQSDFYSVFKTWGSGHELCRIPLPNQDQYTLDGKRSDHAPLSFYAYGSTLTSVTIRRLVATYLRDPNLRSYRPDICFGHTVSESVTTEVEQLLGLPSGTAYRTFSRYGNTVSASLPLAISLAHGDGSLKRGDRVLCVMGSAGISVGFATFTF